MLEMLKKYTQKQLQEMMIEKSLTVSRIIELMGPDNNLSNVKDELGQGDATAKLERFKAIMKEHGDIHDALKEWEPVSKARKAADESAGLKAGEMPGREQPGESKTEKRLGERFKSGLADLKSGKEIFLPGVDVKTIMRTGAGWDPENMRLPRVELYPLRALKVRDIFPEIPYGGDTVTYMEETTHTNNAAEIAEETNASSPTAVGEAALALTQRSVPIENVGVWIPATDQQLADMEGIGAWIENRLAYMLGNRLDGQLVAGNGSTPNLRGVLNASNLQTQAKGTDPALDSIFKAMTKVRGTAAGTGFAEPSHVLFHPNDWQDIRLVRTAEGLYIMGNPTESGPERVWGIPAVITSAETENTACVGDFTGYSELRMRQGISFKISDSHGSLFTAFTQAIRASIRCAAIYYRGSAFCQVTGL